MIGQEIKDATGIGVTEFFNPSCPQGVEPRRHRDQNVGGPILTPDLQAVDGTLTPIPETDYALAVNGVELHAPVVAQRENAVLYRIDGSPMKLAGRARRPAERTAGSSAEDEPDVARGSYTRYDVSHDEPGLAIVKLTRISWCPDPSARKTGRATVRIGTVGIGAGQAAADRAT